MIEIVRHIANSVRRLYDRDSRVSLEQRALEYWHQPASVAYRRLAVALFADISINRTNRPIDPIHARAYAQQMLAEGKISEEYAFGLMSASFIDYGKDLYIRCLRGDPPKKITQKEVDRCFELSEGFTTLSKRSVPQA